jgi:hypothetical protein
MARLVLARLCEPLPPSTVLLSNQHRRGAQTRSDARFPVGGPRALLHPPYHHESAAGHPINIASGFEASNGTSPALAAAKAMSRRANNVRKHYAVLQVLS